MTENYRIYIKYRGGFVSSLPFRHWFNAREYYQNRVSYSGSSIERVEVKMPEGGIRAVWDISWDEASKKAGLES